jgi:hypothetical protein
MNWRAEITGKSRFPNWRPTAQWAEIMAKIDPADFHCVAYQRGGYGRGFN